MASTINAKSTGSGSLESTADASGVLALQTGGVTAMTIDTSQNVGIGTASPASKLDVRGNIVTISGTSQITYGVATGVGYIDAYAPTGAYLKLSTADSSGNVAERMRIDSSGNLLFNSGYGSVATAYGCRAWVNFNGTGTVAIRASGNVTSITDNNTGDYTVNFTNAMPDANYSVSLAVREDTSGTSALGAWNQIFRSSAAISTTSVRVLFANGATKYDVDTYCVQIFR